MVLSTILGKALVARRYGPLFLLMMLSQSPRSGHVLWLSLQDTKHLGEKWPIPLEPTLMFSASCWPFTGWIKHADSYFNSSLVSWTFDASHTRASQIICEKGYFFPNPACTSTFLKVRKRNYKKEKRKKKSNKHKPRFLLWYSTDLKLLSYCHKCL